MNVSKQYLGLRSALCRWSVQLECSTDGFESLLCFTLIYSTTNANLAGCNGIDIDLGLGQGIEHFLGDSVMTSHADTDHGDLGDIIANENALAIYLILNLLLYGTKLKI